MFTEHEIPKINEVYGNLKVKAIYQQKSASTTNGKIVRSKCIKCNSVHTYRLPRFYVNAEKPCKGCQDPLRKLEPLIADRRGLKRKDYSFLEGKRVGRVTAIRQANEEEQKRGPTLFLVVCDCDPERRFFVRASELNRNKVKSCGCIRNNNLFKTTDIVIDPGNKVDGVAEIIEIYDTDNVLIKHHCGCYQMLTLKEVRKLNYLPISATDVLPDIKKVKGNYAGLVGHVFGKLTIIRLATPEERRTHIKTKLLVSCECTPDHLYFADAQNIIKGKLTNCGCMKKQTR